MKNNLGGILTKPELQFWIPIVLIVVSAVVQFGVLNTRISLLEQRQDRTDDAMIAHIADNQRFIQSMNDYINQNQAIQTDIQVKLAQIQTDLAYIKEKVK